MLMVNYCNRSMFIVRHASTICFKWQLPLHRLVNFNQTANNVVVVWRLFYINTLKQELGSTKTNERISTDERSIVNTHSIDITAKFAVSIKEKQDRLPTLYWLPKLHK